MRVIRSHLERRFEATYARDFVDCVGQDSVETKSISGSAFLVVCTYAYHGSSR